MRRRPTGFTILAVLLGWLSLGALGNAAMAMARPYVLRQFGLTPELVVVSALLYGVTAGATAVGLWRVAPWALGAFLAWSGVVIASAVAVGVDFEVPDGTSWLPFASVVLFAAILTPIALYIRRRLAAPV